MKFCFLILFLTPFAQSKQISCQQNLRDVSVVVSDKNNILTINIQSPMGYDYLPIIEGPIRPSMKGWLNYQFQQLKVLGSGFKAEFPSSNCIWGKSKNSNVSTLQCSGANPSMINNLRFHTLSISHILENGLQEVTEYRKFRLSASVLGENGEDTFFISIPVSNLACQERE